MSETIQEALERIGDARDLIREEWADDQMMERVLKSLGFVHARVASGVVYLEGKGTVCSPPLDIHSVARMILSQYPVQTRKTLDASITPLSVAREYAHKKFKEYNLNLYSILPSFDQNYQLLQHLCKQYALNIPRAEMPVIEPKDMYDFETKLEGGYIDLLRKGTYSSPYLKEVRSRKRGYVYIGERGGDPSKVIETQVLRVPAKDLKPLQSQIWFNLVIQYIIQYGLPLPGSHTVNTTIIKSKENYILDGHHRWAQVILYNPRLTMKVLDVPLNIDTLLKVGRSYTAYVGNAPNR